MNFYVRCVKTLPVTQMQWHASQGETGKSEYVYLHVYPTKFPRNVVASYSVRKIPRCCRIGTT